MVAPLGVTQAALPLLLASPRPRLLNVTSDAAAEAYEGWGGYGAGKAALEHLGAVLAVEYPSVSVWSVDPGDLRTECTKRRTRVRTSRTGPNPHRWCPPSSS